MPDAILFWFSKRVFKIEVISNEEILLKLAVEFIFKGDDCLCKLDL